MTEPSHEALDRHVEQARERLFAKLDVLDHRARELVREATSTTRATALGLAGALALSFGLALAERASQRLRHRYYTPAPRRSLVGDALRVGAVAVMFVAVSGWAKRASHSQAARRASEPQLGRFASPVAAVPGSVNAGASPAGTSHALSDFSLSDTERFQHD